MSERPFQRNVKYSFVISTWKQNIKRFKMQNTMIRCTSFTSLRLWSHTHTHARTAHALAIRSNVSIHGMRSHPNCGQNLTKSSTKNRHFPRSNYSDFCLRPCVQGKDRMSETRYEPGTAHPLHQWQPLTFTPPDCPRKRHRELLRLCLGTKMFYLLFKSWLLWKLLVDSFQNSKKKKKPVFYRRTSAS